MAVSKKSAEALQKDLSILDKRIEALDQQLRALRDKRKKLRARIAETQASELMVILEEREISFEAAKDILASAKEFRKEAENHEYP